MLIIYSLIVILSFSLIGTVLLNSYKTKRIKNQEIRLFQTANIVAETYKSNTQDIIFARTMVKTYAKQADARILVTDTNGKVLIDSYNTYIGDTLDNAEIKSSIKGESASKLYNVDTKDILQLSVPITTNNGIETKVTGIVLISASMNMVKEDMNELKSDILKVSSISLILSIILILIAANSITRPLRDLTYGVNKISSGALGYQIEKNPGGEFGQLVSTFNKMSCKLSNIEKNRKIFINNISHELRTPLTSIKALTESLSIGNTHLDTYKEYIMDIHGETERMEKMVNYLMNSIKLEDVTLELKEENIKILLENSIKLITPYAEKNGVRMNFKADHNIYAKCDYNKIKEVILNLLDNSIKYKDPKKKENYIIITIQQGKDESSIIIEDNGLGIEEKKLPYIFQRGFRALDQDHQKDKLTGHGIGLTIVKNIIDEHKWAISVESSLRIGSTFTITIPN